MLTSGNTTVRFVGPFEEMTTGWVTLHELLIPGSVTVDRIRQGPSSSGSRMPGAGGIPPGGTGNGGGSTREGRPFPWEALTLRVELVIGVPEAVTKSRCNVRVTGLGFLTAARLT